MAKSILVIEVGSFALRDPITHEFLPSVPLYIEKTEQAEKSETILLEDITRLFANNMQQYVENGGLTGGAAAQTKKMRE